VRSTSQGVSRATGRLGGIVGVPLYGVLAGVGGPGASLLFFAGTALAGAAVSAVAVAGHSPGRSAGGSVRCIVRRMNER
jgi:hypothetical protein